MTHYSRLSAIVLDVPEPDHGRELDFWQAATGAQLTRYANHPEYHGGRWPGHDMTMLLQRLGDGPARVHLDIHTDDVAAEAARLERHGAHLVSRVKPWWVMQDPAGLYFCVVPEEPGSLTGDNAQRWD